MKKLLLIVSLLIVSLASVSNGIAAAPEFGGKATATSITSVQPGLSYRYERTYGTPGVPYLDSPGYLNGPYGMYMDTSNNLYVLESAGHRLLKYGPAGNLLLMVGNTGVCTDFCGGRDLALDGAGNIWVAGGSTIYELDPTGNLLRTINSSDSGEPVGFSGLMGIAFDSQGRMYVSDSNNQRVLIYTFSGGAPVYSATIGVTGVVGSDDNHFNDPVSLAVDSSDRLYVADQGNERVQRCSFSSGCTTFASTPHLASWGFSVWVDSHDKVYISDPGWYDKVIECDVDGNCSDLIDTGDLQSSDMVADTAGNVYVSFFQVDFTIRKYDSAGTYLGVFAGTSGVPFLTDDQHFDSPKGIVVDANDNIAVLAGAQLIKMDANGSRFWAYGHPGVIDGSGSLFAPAGLAVDANGKFYVASQLSVDIINGDGTYYNTLGGSGDEYNFHFTHGVGVDRTTGTIYASDNGTNRVQVYNSALVYQASIGDGYSGSDNAHFNDPGNITVDKDGNIYVMDRGNWRIQKFNRALVYQKTFPISNTDGNMAVDSQGRLFIAEGNHVYVYDTNGNYLATIGGKDMTGNSSYVAVDSAGSVYIAMGDNDCVVKYVPTVLGAPGWQQANTSGFASTGSRFSQTWSMQAFDGSLYAGVNDASAHVWRLNSGQTQWQAFNPPWSTNNLSVMDMQALGANLYAGTSNSSGAEIWRTDGATWNQVVSGGFGDANNSTIEAMAVFNGSLYAAVGRADGVLQVWRSASGDSGSWTQVDVGGFGSGGVPQYGMTMDVYNGALYLGIQRSGVAELWKTTNGADWSAVFTNGLAPNNTNVSAMAVFGGNFYIGMRNVTNGGSLWSSSNGTDFTPVFSDGLGDPANGRLYGLTVYFGHLYLAFGNFVTGAEVWRSPDGTHWENIAANGWGDPSNQYSSYFNKGMVVFNNRLYVSTMNNFSGSQVWEYNPGLLQIFLPLVKR